MKIADEMMTNAFEVMLKEINPFNIYNQMEELLSDNKKEIVKDKIETIKVLAAVIEDNKINKNDLNLMLHRNGFIGINHFNKFYKHIECADDIFDVFNSIQKYYYRYSYEYNIIKEYLDSPDKIVNKDIDEIFKWEGIKNKDIPPTFNNENLNKMMYTASVYSKIFLRTGVDVDIDNWRKEEHERVDFKEIVKQEENKKEKNETHKEKRKECLLKQAKKNTTKISLSDIIDITDPKMIVEKYGCPQYHLVKMKGMISCIIKEEFPYHYNDMIAATALTLGDGFFIVCLDNIGLAVVYFDKNKIEEYYKDSNSSFEQTKAFLMTHMNAFTRTFDKFFSK